MKLLLDANLSWRLCKQLQPYFDDVRHVNYIGLEVPAKDFEIWKWASDHNYIVVTNDRLRKSLFLQVQASEMGAGM